MSASSAEVEEISALVNTLCQNGSNADARKAAEQRLIALQRDPLRWRFHLDLLFYVDDNCVFFLGQGLLSFVWTQWRVLSSVDRDFLSTTVTKIIAQRSSSLSQYARCKVEQVLAGICALSRSLNPALTLVAEPGHPGIEMGLSVLRTVLEEALSDDKRLTPDHRQQLVVEVSQIAAATVNLCCRVCSDYLRTDCSDETLLIVALDVLKVLIGRLPVGSHLTSELLDVLCSMAARAIEIPNGMTSNSRFDSSMRNDKHFKSSVSSIYILTELMGKRYIPRIQQSSLDGGVDVLVTLVGKVVGLLQRYKPVCHHSQNADAILPLLEFIRTFAECHLERCSSTPTRNVNMEAVVLTFLDEFASISRSFTVVEVLLHAALVWQELLAVETIRRLLLNSDTALHVALFFFKMSLLINNEDMELQCMEMAESMSLPAIGDREIRALVAGLSEKATAGHAEGAEEPGCVGISFLTVTATLISEFMESEKFLLELRRIVPGLIDEQLEKFSCIASVGCSTDTMSVHALDILFLCRFLPVCGSTEDTIRKLVGIFSHLVENLYYRGGRAVVALVLQLSQLLGGICYSCRRGGCYDQQYAVQLASFNAAVPLVRCVLCSLNACPPGNIEPLFEQVNLACCCTLMQCISGLPLDFLKEHVSVECRQVLLGDYVLDFVQQLLNSSLNISLEVATLLCCIASRISTDVPGAMARSMGEMCTAVVDSDGVVVSMATWSEPQVAFVIRTVAALCAITKQHSGVDAPTRGVLLRAVEALDAIAPILVSSACKGFCEAALSQSAATYVLKSMCIVISQIISLNVGLVQVFGRKSFGKSACTVLGILAEFLMTPVGSGELVDAVLVSISTGEGVILLKQLLFLISAVATSTSSSIATIKNELDVSHRILQRIVGDLSNSRVCSEILGELIKTGWTVVMCHWPKTSRIGTKTDGDSETKFDAIIPVISTLISLFEGCLSGASVPPQDTVIAMEGLIQANTTYGLFAADWFQLRFLGSILASSVNAVLSGQMSCQMDMLEQLLEMICTGAGSAVWPVFKDISGKIATTANCNPDVVRMLIVEEENIAIRRCDEDQGVSTAGCEQTDKNIRTIYGGMKAVLVTLSSEITRCKVPIGFAT